MINLIKNELFKTFHKKTLYIYIGVLSVFVLFLTLLVNIDPYVESFEDETYLVELQHELSLLDNTSETYQKDKYALQMEIELYKLFSEHQKNYLNDYLSNEYSILLNNYYEAKLLNNKLLVKKLEDEITNAKQLINSKNEMYFYKLKLERLKNTAFTKNSLEQKNHDYIIKLYKYRINNNVKEDDFLSESLYILENTYYDYLVYADKDVLSDDEKNNYHNYRELILTNEYIIKNQVDVNNYKTTSYSLNTLFENYTFFIVLFSIMIAAGIISDEFNKGTIKNLLTTPYKRHKILLSKFITVIISYLFILISLHFIIYLISSIVFGFNTLNIPVLIYNKATETLMVYPIVKSLLVNFVYSTPIILFLISISFSLSVIIPSTAFATTITFGTLLASEIIQNLAIVKNVKFLKYFITLNWDFSYYIHGGENPFVHTNLKLSLIIYILYFLILMGAIFIVFNKKDIKNT